MARELGRFGSRFAVAISAASLVIALSPGAAAASPASPTLHAGGRYVTFGQQVVLSGRAAPHAALALQESAFPFSAAFHTVAVVHVGASGRYSARLRPRLATRIRVLEGSAPSATVTVYVFPHDTSVCNLCRLTNSAGAHTLALTDVFTAAPGPTLGPEYFYYGLSTSAAAPAQLRLVQTVALSQIAPGRFEGAVRYQVHFPSGPFRFVYETCTKEDEAHTGLGLPGAGHCGDPTLRVSALSSAGYVN